MYRVQYIHEPWSEQFEVETPSDGVLGEFTWEELQDNLTDGIHGSGWVPGHYLVTYVGEDQPDREGTFDVYIGAPSLTDRLRNLSTDQIIEWLQGAFIGDTGKILADALDRGKDLPSRARRVAAGE